MRRFFLTLVLCITIISSCVLYSGCKKTYSYSDVGNLYSSITKNENTKDFFGNNGINITFNSIPSGEQDKNYLFTEVYNNFVNSSSGLFFGLIKRVEKNSSISSPVEYIVKNLSKEGQNEVYKKLLVVNDCLNALAENKLKYEETNGNLCYKALIENYNDLILSLYDLNDSFAKYYFSSIGSYEFSPKNNDFSDTNIKDYLWFQLSTLSKVSFNFELLNFEPNNPLGEINTWYESTLYLKSFVALAKDLSNTLYSSSNLAMNLNANYNSSLLIKNLTNMQSEQPLYNQEYVLFYANIQELDITKYLTVVNKSAYVSNCSTREKSLFANNNNFLNGKYKMYFDFLKNLSDEI